MRRDETLSIVIEERLVLFEAADLQHWRTSGSWGTETWHRMLPDYEWDRIPKYLHQPLNHFAEIMQMHAFARDGLSCLYERYDLFRPPREAARVYSDVPLLEMFGADKLSEIRAAAHGYAEAESRMPSNPDLLVYRDSPAGRSAVRFVEAKRRDPVQRRQLLGLALISRVLQAPVEIVRYVDSGKPLPVRKTYRRDFRLALNSRCGARRYGQIVADLCSAAGARVL